LEAADLVITMAGYNSICEILTLKKKALVIPREGPRAEQRMRSRIFAERGIVDVLYANELFPGKLAARIVEKLTDSSVQDEPGIDTDGANCVARLFAERTSHCARPVPAVANGGMEGHNEPLASRVAS
jgi:predicted glycosyltransferase